MRRLATRRTAALCVIGSAALVPVLSACGGSSSSSSASTATGRTSTSSTSSTATTSTTSGGGTASTTACAANAVAVSINTNGSGGAGSFYYTMKFTNTSGKSCTLAGYPGVSAVTSSGTQLGSAAGRSATVTAKTITLANGASATSVFQLANVANYTASTCGPANAYGLRVYAPNTLGYHTLKFSFSACSKVGPVYMHVTPVVGGTSPAPAPTPTLTACKSSGTVIRVDTNGSGTAGSIAYTINFTNNSGTSCTLAGYPGVSAVDSAGTQLGSAAVRDTSTPVKAITLSNGGTASATLLIAQVSNYDAATCNPTPATGLRIYAPGQVASTVSSLSFSACAKTGVEYLHISAVK